MCTYTFKARIKSLLMCSGKSNCAVKFDYSDKISIDVKGEYGIAYNEDMQLEALTSDKTFYASEKEILNFLSQHSCEILEITYDSCNYTITKVMLNYE